VKNGRGRTAAAAVAAAAAAAALPAQPQHTTPWHCCEKVLGGLKACGLFLKNTQYRFKLVVAARGLLSFQKATKTALTEEQQMASILSSIRRLTCTFSFGPRRPAASRHAAFLCIACIAAAIAAAEQRFVSAVQHKAGEEGGVCNLIRHPFTSSSTCQFGKVGHFSGGFVCNTLYKRMRPNGSSQHARTHRMSASLRRAFQRMILVLNDDDNDDDANANNNASPAAATPQSRFRRRRVRGSS